MRRAVLTILVLGAALPFAACQSSNSAPATQPAAGGTSAPTSIAGAPRGPTSAWTTPPSGSYAPTPAPSGAQPGAPVYVAPGYIAPPSAPAAPAAPAGPVSSCGGGQG